MSKHTPGPWEIDKQDIFGRSETGGRMFVCTWSTKKANACLIASAPELLEALKDAVSALRYIREAHGELYGVGFDRVETNSAAAIAKAEGAL